MNVKIQPLYEGDPECDLVRAYAMNTSKTDQNPTSMFRYGYQPELNIKKIRVFKIDRKGEQE